MAHSKPTPKNVQRIAAPRAEGEPVRGDVIPIRGLAPPIPPAAIAFTPPRLRHAPVARRPWRVLLVPPTPGSPTRGFEVARWQARAALGLLIVMLIGSTGAAAAVATAVRTPDLFATADEVAVLRAQLVAKEDSLALARTALDEIDVASDAVTERDARIDDASVTPGRRRPLISVFARGRTGRAPAGSASPAPVRMEGLPVIGTIASRFSLARQHPLLRISRPHLGVDVSAPSGTLISAPADGQVRFVGRKFGFGLVVEVDHGNGVVTRYAHCRSALVRTGDRVARGAAIATVGSSGLTSGPHLHYEVLVEGRPVDPLRYLFATGALPADSAVASPPLPAASSAPAVSAPEAAAASPAGLPLP